jgi:hypothetical protein
MPHFRVTSPLRPASRHLPAAFVAERRLLLALLERQILDARGSDVALRDEARAWLLSPAARELCGFLELPWARLRDWVQAGCPAPHSASP